MMRPLPVLVTIALAALPVRAGAQEIADAGQTSSTAPVESAQAGGSATASIEPQAPAKPPAPVLSEYIAPLKHVVDFGVRGTDIAGDGARYERYRDLGNGLFLENFRLGRETANHWFLDVAGDHVGRHDQRFTGSFILPGKFKATARWDQIPMIMSRTTQTLLNTDQPNVLTINDSLQSQVEASASALPSVLLNAQVFDMKSRRHIAEGGGEYLASPDLTVHSSFRYMDRDGVIPIGGTIGGHSRVEEIPAPVRHQLMDTDGGAEFAHGPIVLRGGYAASLFHNDFTSVTYDSPWRLTDSLSQSSRGRSSLPPSNSLFSVNGLASVKLPGRSRASIYFSTGLLKDAADTAVLPQTINSFAANLQPLPRALVQGEARTVATNLTFTSHPSRHVDISARYRYYDYRNRTPEFAIYQRVPYDNTPSAVATTPFQTEPFGMTRSSFDGDVRVLPRSALSIGVGYTRLEDQPTFRIFGTTTENIARLSFDSVGAGWFTLRTKYEYSQKRGVFDQDVLNDMATEGEQPGMRHFDLAARDRTRVTVLGSLMPSDYVSVNLSVAAGKDDYLQSLFGLRDNKHNVYSAGLDATPRDDVILSASYSLEKYRSLSRSRQATNATQFKDESRNWATNGNDQVHSVVASAQLLKIVAKTDVIFAYDFNRSTSLYTYITGPVPDRTLPEESTVIVSTLPPPVGLPRIFSQLNRGTVDAIYAVTARLGIGLSYWYEQYQVDDFTLDAQAIPRLDLPNAVLIGYSYRPYTANTVWGRLIYRW